MHIRYDRETDTLTIEFSDAPIAESAEDKPGVILDYSADGHVVGIEILHYSKVGKEPGKVVMEGIG